ncbi:TetR/AcrR family transcriptional regulator [Aeromicrobium endophyticum]|uniref:TetR/AcrR family transcriptional regulator n=1 Tax=Aeromicrobium endophyticum TaxID=2292704 RepID=A0A371PAZ1_9ACTN|nr:TetR/AcrR family transcriptional regulator [Aeromicrobium endophyticum]REK72620.1 TetR/AcrR family transcriptional regulator [Aeromicrobium endophyticum]
MPPTTVPKPAPRERLLAAAETLFYDEGIHIGVDRLCAVAEVSKRSMYQHFGGKDDVIVEMLRARAGRLAAAWSSSEGRTPRARILAVFDSVREMSASPDFHGCPFVNVATELKDREHPANVAALGYKLELNRFFEDQARSGGAADPQALGVQLTMMFDGACAYSVVRGGTTDAALGAVETLLDAQGVTD